MLATTSPCFACLLLFVVCCQRASAQSFNSTAPNCSAELTGSLEVSGTGSADAAADVATVSTLSFPFSFLFPYQILRFCDHLVPIFLYDVPI